MSGIPSIREAFRLQGRACAQLGSPFMSELMPLLAELLSLDTAVGARVLGWSGDPRPSADSVPLRLAGGLHSLALSGKDEALKAAYPPNTFDADRLRHAVETALVRHEAHLQTWLDRPPQTNEIRRAVTLIPALHLFAARTGKPLALWEIGCSAGLTLRADRFRLQAGGTAYGPEDAAVQFRPDWQGTPPAPGPLQIVDRRGVDLAPLDPTDPEHRLRLLSYLWPDQPERRALTEGGIAEAQALPAQVDQADAVDWLATELPNRPAGCATLLYHTVAWQYLPPEARAKGDAMIAEAGAQATPDAPLGRFSMEADDRPMAALTLQIWPGGERIDLGRANFHGRAVHWTG